MKSEQMSGAIFLIGLGLLWVTGWWFPGMLFVIGATIAAQALSGERGEDAITGALWMFGLGFIFWLNLPWGVVFILIGLSILCKSQCANGGISKRKNDEKLKNDDIDFV